MIFIELAVACGLAGLLIASWIVGKRLGDRISGTLTHHPQLGIVQAAILSLLGLLLGFCFAGATSRFADRQDALAREANSITSLHNLTMMLPDDTATEARSQLKTYVAKRIVLFSKTRVQSESTDRRELQDMQTRIWSTLAQGLKREPQVIEPVSNAYVEFADALGSRHALVARHLPIPVLVSLIVCAMASMMSVGMGVEKADKRFRAPAYVLIFLVALTLWIILDLDSPRLGLIELDPQPLLDAAEYVGSH